LLKKDASLTDSREDEALNIRIKHSKVFSRQPEIIRLSRTNTDTFPVRA